MNKNITRFLPIAIIFLCVAVVYFTGAYKYLTWASVKMHHRALRDYLSAHPFQTPIAFIFVYILTTALSIPGGIILSLLGGFLFPQPFSTIYVVISATCGATIIFLSMKTAFGESLKKTAEPLLQKIEKDFSEHQANYLLFLRFAPLIPFWIVNIASAFLNVKLWTFVWTTFIGVIPGAIVLTLAGAGLQTFFESNQPLTFHAICNTQVKIAFGLLAVVAIAPVLVKKFCKKR